ncbi:MAG: hypothetical protein EPO24_07090 [Bacteroidetes bacterium]|nr:MAG: hypothetical protein EPO24_07090 [Bacteroidota bacterium]
MPAFSQSVDSANAIVFHQVKFSVANLDTSFQLPHQFIVRNSDTVWVDTVRLIRNTDYTLDERWGRVRLNYAGIKNPRGEEILRSAQNDSVVRNDTLNKNDSIAHIVEIHYKALPFIFEEKYQHQQLIYERDTSKGIEKRVAKQVTPFSFDDVFTSSNLQKSGSLVRGLTIGTNRDLTLNSGFRMQLSGNLTDDIEVIAALTDENSPIQPEGTTQTLQEIDKVFIELRSRDVSATLGDFNLNVQQGEFGNFTRKLQGAKLDAVYRTGFSHGDILAAGATTRGKYASQSFIGIDGVQGPYRLLGKNGERDIIVIAGTERVYINGERVVRGETNDYVIEYGTGEITFTARTLISSASRVTVDYEYSDRQYNRTLLSAKAGTQFLKDKYSLNFSFAKESDDYESPVDLQLSEQDKAILAGAGGNRLGAYRSGVDSVGAGKGNYQRIDTTVFSPSTETMIPYTIYRFNPLDTLNSLYLVHFSYVGNGIGDYSKISVGNYSFAGIGNGSYLPIRLLPLPEEQTISDVLLGAKPLDWVTLSGEFAHSEFDRNRFSILDDSVTGGNAYKLSIQFEPKDITLGNTNIGLLKLNLNERYITKHFNGLDRINDVEFTRKWSSENTAGNEELREAKVKYDPVNHISLGGEYGTLDKSQFNSKRFLASINLSPAALPMMNYTLEEIRSKDYVKSQNGYWLRQMGRASYQVSENVVTAFRIENENRQLKALALDSLQFGSYRFTDFGPSVGLSNIGLLNFNAEWGWRLFDSLRANQPIPTIKTFTQHYMAELTEWNDFSSKMQVTIQDIKRINTELSGNQLDNSLLLRWQSRYNPLERGIESDWFYEAASERTAKMERIFQQVPKGTGNYVYAGDLNGNRIVDESDFQPTRFDGEYIALYFPTEEYIPAINLKTSGRLRLNGFHLFDGNNSWTSKLFSALSTETYVRIEEKSTETEKSAIYFLHFNKFLNNLTTLAGSQLMTQDIYVLENNQNLNIRFRYSQRRGLTKYATQDELTYARERSVRIRWSFLKEISNQIDYSIKDDNLLANQLRYRKRSIILEALSYDLSYRPRQELELGFKFSVGSGINYGQDKAELNDQSIRAVYSFKGAGQARVELVREEAIVTNITGILPFELTSGRVAGKTWIARLQSDYRLTQFLQATVSYEGRIEGGREAVHTGRAEVKAFF